MTKATETNKASNNTTKQVKAQAKVNRAVNQPGERRKAINRASKVNSLPVHLGKLAHETAGILVNVKPANEGLTILGHKAQSKAGAIDAVLLAAMTGNFDIAELVKMLVQAESRYGKADTLKALVGRVRAHLGMKRNGNTYFGGPVHMRRPHNLTAEQAVQVGRFGAQLADALLPPLKAACK